MVQNHDSIESELLIKLINFKNQFRNQLNMLNESFAGWSPADGLICS